MGGEKGDIARSSVPAERADFADDTLRDTRFTELKYGPEHGTDRREAAKFSEQVRRCDPELYTLSSTVKTRHLPSVDFSEGMYGRFRRLVPIIPDTGGRGDLRRLAPIGHGSSGGPVWKFPPAREISSAYDIGKGRRPPIWKMSRNDSDWRWRRADI